MFRSCFGAFPGVYLALVLGWAGVDSLTFHSLGSRLLRKFTSSGSIKLEVSSSSDSSSSWSAKASSEIPGSTCQKLRNTGPTHSTSLLVSAVSKIKKHISLFSQHWIQFLQKPWTVENNSAPSSITPVAHLVQAHNQCHVESITINMCEPSTVKTQYSFILAERLWKYYFNRGTIHNSAIPASCHMSQTFMIKMCPQALINAQYSTVWKVSTECR